MSFDILRAKTLIIVWNELHNGTTSSPLSPLCVEWGSRGREFDSRHSDQKSNDFTLEIVGFFCLWADLIWF